MTGTKGRTRPRSAWRSGVHNHQPLGNFDWVFRTHYEEAYRPFLEAMAAHPAVPFSLHIKRPAPGVAPAARRPTTWTRYGTVARGPDRDEGWGVLEAILAAIPDPDKAGAAGTDEQLSSARIWASRPGDNWLGRAGLGAAHSGPTPGRGGTAVRRAGRFRFLAAGVRPGPLTATTLRRSRGTDSIFSPSARTCATSYPSIEPEEVTGTISRDWLTLRCTGGALEPAPPSRLRRRPVRPRSRRPTPRRLRR